MTNQILADACNTFKATLAKASYTSKEKQVLKAIDAWKTAEKSLRKPSGAYYRA